MDFRRVTIGAFGRLRNLDTGESPLPRLVVVQGSNEAGKSTFFQFLTSLLYGFYPASRDAHPYAPWDGGDAVGEAEILLGDGDVIEVQRRLLSSPTGSLSRNGTQEDLRNRTLPCAEHVPLTVFRQVFALTLGELARLEGESWGRVQDRLVAGMGASDLGSVREAAEGLEKEAGELWRPNRRGNQEVRDLRERLRELRMRSRTASEGDRRLREAARERDRVREELRSAREEREACRLYVERFRALLPIRSQLRRIEALEEEAGDPGELAGIPADPAGRLDELEGRLGKLEERLEALDAEAEEPRDRIAGDDPVRASLLERRSEVRAVVARIAGCEPERVRRGQLEQQIRDLEHRIGTAGVELFDGAWAEDSTLPERVRRVPVGELRSALERHAAALESLRMKEGGDEDRAPEPSRPLRWVGPALTGMGAAGLVLAVVAASAPLGVVAALLLGIGAAVTGMEVAERRTRRGRNEGRKRRIAEARRAEGQALEGVMVLLGDLPFADRVIQPPSPALAGRLQRLQELLRDLDDRSATLEELTGRLDEVARDVRALAADTGLDLPTDAGAAAHVLDQRLRDAESAREAAGAARRELDRLARERDRIAAEAEELRGERDALVETLRGVGEGDVERGLRWARQRLQARDRAAQLRDELARSHHDLDEIREKIAAAEEADEDWAVDDEALARRRAREEELTHRIEELGRRQEGLEKDMAYLRDGVSVDAVEGEILAVESRLEAATRERDRLRVLAAVLREADRRFREEHQPDVLRLAGLHLSAITAGRYRRVLLGEDRDGTFLLRGPDYPMPMEVGEPVSTGTREQVYLALRLAVLDHLDQGGERLPLFMDEAFVNWDAERRERTFALLEEVARTRQVFVFTCHEAMARSLADHGARLIRLEAVS